MTDERLAELERVCAAAPPGRWVQEYGNDNPFTGPPLAFRRVVSLDGLAELCAMDCDGRRTADVERAKAMGDFICAARDALPELIAEVRRLRTQQADTCHVIG